MVLYSKPSEALNSFALAEALTFGSVFFVGNDYGILSDDDVSLVHGELECLCIREVTKGSKVAIDVDLLVSLLYQRGEAVSPEYYLSLPWLDFDGQKSNCRIEIDIASLVR